MASYMIRGLPDGSIPTFKARCREAGVSPDEVLRALLLNTHPVYDLQNDVVTITHRLTIHMPAPVSHG